MNENFRPIFQRADSLENKMRNCRTKELWQQLKDEYRALLADAMQVFKTYSTVDKYKAFKDRETTKISAIYQNVKRLWETEYYNAEMEKQQDKEYVFYDSSNYQADLQNEMNYWQDTLFPYAMENNLPDYKVEFLYSQHLNEQYWHTMCCKPDIGLKNEMRKHYSIFKKEWNGQPTDNTDDWAKDL